jgi:hypothetical protein
MIARLSSAVRSLLGDTSRPLPQHAMLEREYVHLHGSLPPDYPIDDPDADGRLRAIHGALHQRNHAALCLSGGGIRSASFAVGILQGLARRRLLDVFDYLSTVAGGGYTGGWLSAWLHHAREAGEQPSDVFRELAGDEASATKPEPEPVRRIREYSNYLDPQLGLFSVDIWTLVSTVVRNLLLNWLVLIPLLAAALLVPRLYYALVGLGAQHWLDWASLDVLSDGLVFAGFGLLALGLAYIVLDLPSAGNRQLGQRASWRSVSRRCVSRPRCSRCIGPGPASSIPFPRRAQR